MGYYDELGNYYEDSGGDTTPGFDFGNFLNAVANTATSYSSQLPAPSYDYSQPQQDWFSAAPNYSPPPPDYSASHGPSQPYDFSSYFAPSYDDLGMPDYSGGTGYSDWGGNNSQPDYMGMAANFAENFFNQMQPPTEYWNDTPMGTQPIAPPDQPGNNGWERNINKYMAGYLARSTPSGFETPTNYDYPTTDFLTGKQTDSQFQPGGSQYLTDQQANSYINNQPGWLENVAKGALEIPGYVIGAAAGGLKGISEADIPGVSDFARDLSQAIPNTWGTALGAGQSAYGDIRSGNFPEVLNPNRPYLEGQDLLANIRAAEQRGLQSFGQLNPIEQLGFSFVDPTNKLVDATIHPYLEGAKGLYQASPVARVADNIGQALESPQSKNRQLEVAYDQLQPRLEEYASDNNLDFHHAAQQFVDDPQFRKDIGFRGDYEQVGNELAANMEGIYSESTAKTYGLDNEEPATGGPMREDIQAQMAQYEQPKPANFDDTLAAHQEALRDQMFQDYRKSMPEQDAQVKAEIDSRTVTSDIKGPEGLDQLRQEYPSVAKQADYRIEQGREAPTPLRTRGEPYTAPVDALKEAGIEGLDAARRRAASPNRPPEELRKALKIPKYAEALEPNDFGKLVKQYSGVRTKAIIPDKITGELRPARNLEQFGLAGRLVRGPDFLSAYMARAFLNGPGRPVRDVAGNIAKSLNEGYSPFTDKARTAKYEKLGLSSPDLSGGMHMDAAQSKRTLASNLFYGAVNPAGEGVSWALRGAEKLTKGKFKLGKDVNEFTEHRETSIKEAVRQQAALSAYADNIKQELANLKAETGIDHENLRQLLDGKELDPKLIENMAAEKLPNASLEDALTGEYNVHNLSDEVVKAGDRLDGTPFQAVKDALDSLDDKAAPGTPEFDNAVVSVKQSVDGTFTNLVENEAREIRKANADLATVNAIKFPSMMKQSLMNWQDRNAAYFKAKYEGNDVISRREKARAQAQPAKAQPKEVKPKEPEYVPPKPTPETTASGQGKDYKLTHKVVSLDDLIPSNTDLGGNNPAYNIPGLQPRLRNRKASIAQIGDMAQNLKPSELLTDRHLLSEGSPVVGKDRLVESGNGRTLALRRARQDFPEKWQEYQNQLKESLAQYGIDPNSIKGIKDPVLIRERSENVADRAAFAREANESRTLRMSPFEDALNDADRITDAQLLDFKIGEDQDINTALNSASNADFRRQFLNSLPRSEAATYMRFDGSINPYGVQRLKAAMLAKLFPDEAGSRMVETFLEGEPSIKNFENGIYSAMPKLSRMDALIRTGERPAGLNISEDVAKTLERMVQLKSEGLSVKNYLNQMLMFEETLTPFQRYLIGYFDEIARNPKKVREFFQQYADKVNALPDTKYQTEGLFGEYKPTTKEQLLESITGRKAPEPEAEVTQLERDTGTPQPELEGSGGGRTETNRTPEQASPETVQQQATAARPVNGSRLATSEEKAQLAKVKKPNPLKVYYDEIYNSPRSDIPSPMALRDMAAKYNRVDAATRSRYLETFKKADDNIREVTGNTYKLDPNTFEPIRIKDGKPLKESYLRQRDHIAGKEPAPVDVSPVDTDVTPTPETLLAPTQRAELKSKSEQIFGEGSEALVKFQEGLDRVTNRLDQYGIDPRKPFDQMNPAEKDLAISVVSREILGLDPLDPHVVYGELTGQHAAAKDYIDRFVQDAQKRKADAETAKVQAEREARAQALDRKQAIEQTADQLRQQISLARQRAKLAADRAGYEEPSRIFFDYQRKNLADQALTNWLPFQFWTRQNFAYLARHFANHPMQFAAILNFYNNLEDENKKLGVPDYLRGMIPLWRNPDGSIQMWNFTTMLPFNPLGESESFLTVIDAADLDKTPDAPKMTLGEIMFGSDRNNSKGYSGRNKGLIPTFIRPNPLIDTATKLGLASDFYKAMGWTTDNFGNPGPKEKQTLSIIPGRTFIRDTAARTGAIQELRKNFPGLADLDVEGPINELLFGKNSGKSLDQIQKELAVMEQTGQISQRQAMESLAKLKDGNWTPEALAALDRTEGNNFQSRLLSFAGFSTTLTNTQGDQNANEISARYKQVNKEDKKAVSQFFKDNPGANVLFNSSKSPSEIMDSLAKSEKFTAQQPYFDALAEYNLLKGDRAAQAKYQQEHPEFAKQYNDYLTQTYGKASSVAGKAPEQIKNDSDYFAKLKEYQALKGDSKAQAQYKKDNPEFGKQYDAYIEQTYGTKPKTTSSSSSSGTTSKGGTSSYRSSTGGYSKSSYSSYQPRTAAKGTNTSSSTKKYSSSLPAPYKQAYGSDIISIQKKLRQPGSSKGIANGSSIGYTYGNKGNTISPSYTNKATAKSGSSYSAMLPKPLTKAKPSGPSRSQAAKNTTKKATVKKVSVMHKGHYY